MYDWNDVLIVGDSFCADRSFPQTWPQILTCRLTDLPFKPGRDPRGKGFPGASWWSTRKFLLKEISKEIPKVVVICHTEPFRLPNDDNLGINTRSVLEDIIFIPNDCSIKLSPNFKKAALGYYEHLISEDFHLWSFKQWLQESDKILSSFSKIEKVVHLFCFDFPVNLYQFKKGITFDRSLHSYQRVSESVSISVAPNHFSFADNMSLGVNLYEAIKQYPGDGMILNTKLIGK